MNKDEARLSDLRAERAAIIRSGHITWVHWLVVVLSLALTVTVWQFAKRQVEHNARSEFERASDHVVELIADRMEKYEGALWGGVSAIQAKGGEIRYEEWKVFAKSLRIDVKYPGINGIGVIDYVRPEDLAAYLAEQRISRPNYAMHPDHAEPDFLPSTYIEPSSVNARAVGLDMAHEANRYGAALRARDTGSAQITAPIVLVQDQEKTPGFLLFAPFYKGGVYASGEERREKFAGMVYAPFIFNKLMEGLLGKENREIRVKIRDGLNILYDEGDRRGDGGSGAPTHATASRLDLYGRTWTIDMWSTPEFERAATNSQPLVILVGGLFINALLLALFVLLSGANRRAIGFADRMSRELGEKMTALAKSNEELEQFAYVTSHDLKTPLRGIGDLLEYLEEDLEAYLRSPNANPDVERNIGRLNHQVKRMDSLINGVLKYSSISTEATDVDVIDTGKFVAGMCAELDLRGDQVVLIGEFPTLETDSVRLGQVLANLMGNARKHHHDPERLVLTVSVQAKVDFYVFSITDNGPGIAPRFQQKIFDIFSTLAPKDKVESAGIGLSIVKKAVEKHGGQILVVSREGAGATFTFARLPLFVRATS